MHPLYYKWSVNLLSRYWYHHWPIKKKLDQQYTHNHITSFSSPNRADNCVLLLCEHSQNVFPEPPLMFYIQMPSLKERVHLFREKTTAHTKLAALTPLIQTIYIYAKCRQGINISMLTEQTTTNKYKQNSPHSRFEQHYRKILHAKGKLRCNYETFVNEITSC